LDFSESLRNRSKPTYKTGAAQSMAAEMRYMSAMDLRGSEPVDEVEAEPVIRRLE
jgi:hypothetical protein